MFEPFTLYARSTPLSQSGWFVLTKTGTNETESQSANPCCCTKLRWVKRFVHLVLLMHAYLACYFYRSWVRPVSRLGCKINLRVSFKRIGNCNGNHPPQPIFRPTRPEPPYGEPPRSLHSPEATNRFQRRLARSPFSHRPWATKDKMIRGRETSVEIIAPSGGRSSIKRIWLKRECISESPGLNEEPPNLRRDSFTLMPV